MTKKKMTLDNLICVKLTKADGMMTNQIIKAFRNEGISISYIASRILAVLQEEEGQIIGSIATRANLQQPSVTRAVEQLEESGLAYRMRNGRQVHVYLSEEGRKVADQSLDSVGDIQNRVLGSYSPREKDELLNLLDGLIKQLKEA